MKPLAVYVWHDQGHDVTALCATVLMNVSKTKSPESLFRIQLVDVVGKIMEYLRSPARDVVPLPAMLTAVSNIVDSTYIADAIVSTGTVTVIR